MSKSSWNPAPGRMTALAVVGLGVASIPAGATIFLSVFGDSYIVRDGGRTYSVLDVYMKGSNSADIVGSVFGTTQYPSLFLLSNGRGFMQSNGTSASSWLPTNDDGVPWDSFVTTGNRDQASAATTLSLTLDTNWASGSSGGQIVGQNGGPGWYPGVGASTSTNPYARIGFYNGNTTAINTAKATTNIAGNGITAGQSLNNHWMIGRFAIEVTDDEVGHQETLTLRFAVSGKQNGTSTGTFFVAPSPGRVGYVLTFAPRPCDGDIDIDGQCDGWDLGLLLLDFGPCPGCASDLDGSGTVDTGDMSLLLMDWNAPCGG